MGVDVWAVAGIRCMVWAVAVGRPIPVGHIVHCLGVSYVYIHSCNFFSLFFKSVFNTVLFIIIFFFSVAPVYSTCQSSRCLRVLLRKIKLN